MMVLSLLVTAAWATAAFPQAVTVKGEDGASFAALYGAPARATDGVVFVPAAGHGKEDWQATAEKFWRNGAQVLAVDLPSPAAGASADALEGNVRAGVAYLRAKGVTRVALVGAELGANLVINVAANDPSVVSVVLLSAGMETSGVVASDAVTRFGGRSLLLVASEDDTYGARSARALDALALGAHQLQVYERAGKGTRMLNHEAGLESLLVGFVATHWSVAPAAAAPTQNTRIILDNSPIQTTGPTEPGGAP